MIALTTMPTPTPTSSGGRAPHTFSALFAARVAALAVICCCFAWAPIRAQSPAPAEPAKAAAPPLELNSLAWLDGCWRGDVAQYEFREHWLPLRGGLMVGAGHVIFQGKTQDFGYLRLETRPDGVYYVAISSAKKETPFKLTATATDDKDTIFTFTNPGDEFPQRIIYRRGIDGWLYATVEGKVKDEDKKVIYPMRRVDCQSGEFIRK
jgi:hypothetical protein